jgi:hypothetical protein
MPRGIFERKAKTQAQLEARFWSKVSKTSTCWIWNKALVRGYGHCFWQGRYRIAHIVAYELLIGPVPKGLELDHKCRVTSCVNPAHLEPVTHRENVIVRGVGPFAQRARQTHCLRGHEFTPKNTYIHKSRGVRVCRTCHRDRVNAAGKRQRQSETPDQRAKRLDYFRNLRHTQEYKDKFNAYRRAARRKQSK